MTKPLTDDDRQILESYMQEAFDRFKQIIKHGRPAFRDNEQALNELATGEIFSANQAQRHGLVDEIGFVEGAIDRAAELAGLDPQAVRVVSYKTPLSLFDVLASARAAETPSLDWQSLLELSVPRAYYLATSLPTLAAAP
jgi:protease-4